MSQAAKRRISTSAPFREAAPGEAVRRSRTPGIAGILPALSGSPPSFPLAHLSLFQSSGMISASCSLNRWTRPASPDLIWSPMPTKRDVLECLAREALASSPNREPAATP